MKVNYIGIACLAVLLLTACDESKYELENLVPEEYHKVLYINKSGTQELTLYNTGELNTYAFSVYKGGSDPSLTASGEIAVHSQEEVDVLYGTDYRIIPSGSYSMDTDRLDFASEERSKVVTLSLSTDLIGAAMEANPEATYVLPLYLTSEKDSVNADKSELFIRITDVLTPAMGFTDTDIQPLSYTYGFNTESVEVGFGLDTDNNWDVECQFVVDWSFYLAGSFSYNKNKVLNVNESPFSDEYAYPYRTEGYSVNQQWGYLIDYSNGNGMFNFEEELEQSSLSYAFGTPRVGDFIYKDLNNDKIIDEKDKAPILNTTIPQHFYNFSGGFKYKGFEVNFLFQGTGKFSRCISGVGAYESEYQGVFTDLHLQAWTPERWNNGEEIKYPALSLRKSTNHQPNSFFIMDASYLRLKNAEIAYTLPVNICRKVFTERIRFSLSGQNLFTIDNMRSKFIDPEVGNMGTFQPYRVYNIGVSLTF